MNYLKKSKLNPDTNPEMLQMSVNVGNRILYLEVSELKLWEMVKNMKAHVCRLLLFFFFF